MTYIVTKPVKSKGIAALLVIFFGGLGLFYSSILGGFIMGIIAPVLIWLFLFYGAVSGSISIVVIVIIFCCLYYLICLIWAIRAVNNYNQEIIANSMVSHLNSPNENYQNIIQPSTEINDKLSEQKGELYKDLGRVKNLYDQNKISIEDYNSQKDFLLKKIETLSYNQNVSNASSTYNEMYSEYPTQENKKRITLWIWILSVLLILTLLYLMYDDKSNGFKLSRIGHIFHSNSKDKEEIKNQIEKTYFGIMNGAYTAQNMPGLGPEGLPFYNQNEQAVVTMGLVPFAQLFGGCKIKTKNIDVYNFQDENTAQVRYDLIVSNLIDTIHIDMVVKKIDDYWKLDAEKAFRAKKDKSTKPQKEKVNTANTRLDINENAIKRTLLETSASAYKIPNPLSSIDSTFFFDNKKIFLISNGEIIYVWHIIKYQFRDGFDILNTKEGDEFSTAGLKMAMIKNTGEKFNWIIDPTPLREIYIKDRFLK